MDIFRSIFIWLCRFGISFALSAWIMIATVNATVLDRTVVKNWLAQSGVYDKVLGTQLQAHSGDGGENSVITPAMLQKALVHTFDADYVKAGTNKVLDSTYDWLEGKKNAITFSIPVQEKAAVFTQHLAAQLEAKLSALPACSSRLGDMNSTALTCLPPGLHAADYANQLTKIDDTSFLKEPLTQDSLKNPAFDQFKGLSQYVQWSHMLMWILPTVIILLGTAVVLVSKDMLRGASHLGRQVTISAAITLVGGLFLWYGGTVVDLSTVISGSDPQQTAIISDTVNSLARTILPDFGRALSLYSGILVAIGGTLWLGMFVLRHKKKLKYSEETTK